MSTLAPLDPQTAERVARSLSDEDERTSALSQVFRCVLKTDLNAAERLARAMADEEERADALHAVAAELRDTDPERALAVARRIPEDCRTLTLADIAQSLAPEHPGRAERLYQEAERLAAEVQDEEHGLAATLWIAAAGGSADPERRRHGLLEFPRAEYVSGLVLLSSGLVRAACAGAGAAGGVRTDGLRPARGRPDVGAGGPRPGRRGARSGLGGPGGPGSLRP
ncbi:MULTISPECIES: hypothetical protein [Streptomyces]|uniref:Uncharacterized protein n=1 Tax=Streptomyces violaceoruber TaxID=1935 RepID=A0ACD4WI59_STRVN|nr:MULTISPECIES: hypothetical protein [unclassified Streptomyces]REH24200.1 hypothetical protein BX268_6111 [Streptomyces sp. 2221.1]WOY97474.1 hypothetical protein R2E43_08450 [Streptomyces violaceoruber]BDD75515.1 hypothetical protein JCM4020_61350 [Streptomyces coelicolor]SDT77439.1 hypothetical protein SAMN05428941_6099 [Streptomyces sp. 2114.2]